MKDKLNEYDYQVLSFNNTVRWKNTAQWCRNTMVQEGLLNSDFPKGIWEISKKGIEYLKKAELLGRLKN
ncbi:winged helix-turn-helix domain-containing protein [Thermodesulfobacterium hydrogeniphilum]|uniref:winged helix-turn-helix domain-containing protein n=1 Tax=Thermodesulfobacterium hydrogeniphilum TaxID=161156 RepID=UPI00056E649C|nr:winged helix-turn-helix domain-containing protein [Thermodesulfobacterium hydrogeniphilum]